MSQFRPGQAAAIYEHAKKRGMVDGQTGQQAETRAPAPNVALPAPKAGQGKGKPRRNGKQPNKTEQRMLDICAAKQRRGEIESFSYEGMSLAWGRDEKTGSVMRYTPDVVVIGKPLFNRVTLIEVKGAHIYERDLVRFKGCRAEWPTFDFEMHQWTKGTFTRIL